MVPEQVRDSHFCSYQCVFFCFLFVSVIPCLSLVGFFLWLPEEELTLLVLSSLQEWRYLSSDERYICEKVNIKFCLLLLDLGMYVRKRIKILEGCLIQNFQ
jgi:hypothetical protein